MYRNLTYFTFFFLFCLEIFGQNTVTIDSILLEGNKRTKRNTILNEIELKQGESYTPEILQQKIKESESYLFRANLFVSVSVTDTLYTPDRSHAYILIRMKEKFYTFPLPIFDLEDEFGVWKDVYDFSLSRVSYGMALYFENFTGRRDQFNLKYWTGFNRTYSTAYKSPFFQKGKIRFIGEYINRENQSINYAQIDNVESLYEGQDRSTFQNQMFKARLIYRPQLRLENSLEYIYEKNTVSDSVFIKNPNYLSGDKQDAFSQLIYGLELDKLDNRFYPSNGYYFKLETYVQGIGQSNVNNYHFYPLVAVFIPLGDRFILENQLHYSFGKAEKDVGYKYIPRIFEDNFYMRGYWNDLFKSYNQIHTKTSIHYKLYEKDFNLSGIMPKSKNLPFDSYIALPVDIYLAANLDLGKVKNDYLSENNDLYNRNLYGYGLGLNLMFYNQFSVMIEGNMNDQGEFNLEFGYRNKIE